MEIIFHDGDGDIDHFCGPIIQHIVCLDGVSGKVVAKGDALWLANALEREHKLYDIVPVDAMIGASISSSDELGGICMGMGHSLIGVGKNSCCQTFCLPQSEHDW
jgi:hypothetical protein